MKYCTHCGNENRSSSNFCQSCGKKLDTNNKGVKEKRNSNNKLILLDYSQENRHGNEKKLEEIYFKLRNRCGSLCGK